MISNLLTRDFFDVGANSPGSRSLEIHSKTGFRASGMFRFGDEINLEFNGAIFEPGFDIAFQLTLTFFDNPTTILSMGVP